MYYYGTDVCSWSLGEDYLFERFPTLSAKYAEFGTSRGIGQSTFSHRLFNDFARRGAYMDEVIKQRVKSL